ncbi:hypothetical protein T8K17_07790 [Thalassobaculum sp. OXR-137]|uniref:hypothetical protein n=1 Tax=Thalassobaculum sp. OXR-137 TaxID=3100173 RepID=UPI002AC98452|nr:hypothetical protein [Thalassobaculum sp. OXR-137]WPZ36034.1 hypothetical protein T8K17_07790 [Thalassobaculum sp. OXR-137]
MTAQATTIGGFFGLEPPDRPRADGGVLARWTQGEDWLGFHNARSAFAHLVRGLAPGTVWLPSYLCADMDAGAGPAIRRYGVGPVLDLDDAAFEAALAPGDLVVAVAYFGAPVCRRLRDLALRRPDVTWLEDRAQALSVPIEDDIPGAWRLFSPRKLLGTAEGGLLVGPVSGLPMPSLTLPPVEHDAAAEARAAAATRDHIAEAYRRYVAIERDHAVADLAMSGRTRRILAAASPDDMARRRRENLAILDARLDRYAAPVVERLRGSAAPFGYPLLLADGRDAVAARLAADGVFCAVHWRALGAAETADPVATRLRDGMLTLPLDHRYGPEDMTGLADRVRQALA